MAEAPSNPDHLAMWVTVAAEAMVGVGAMLMAVMVVMAAAMAVAEA